MSKLWEKIKSWIGSFKTTKPALTSIDVPNPESPDRIRFFQSSIQDFGIEPLQYLPDVYACLLEFGFSSGCASLLLAANGEIKLIISHGGGTITPKNKIEIQSMAFQLLALLNNKKEKFVEEKDFSPPNPNTSHFFIRTKSGILKLQLGETFQLRHGSENYDIYSLGQKIITQIRESEIN